MAASVAQSGRLSPRHVTERIGPVNVSTSSVRANEVVANADVDALLHGLTTTAGRDDPYPAYARLRSIAPMAEGPGKPTGLDARLGSTSEEE